MTICADCKESAETVECSDGAARCTACCREADFCWACGVDYATVTLCYAGDESTLPEEWSGACRNCVNDWDGYAADEAYHGSLWDTGR